MPRMLPVGGRGPYAVGIATEHIRTPVATVGDGDGNAFPSEEELWPLELMVQVSCLIDFLHNLSGLRPSCEQVVPGGLL